MPITIRGAWDAAIKLLARRQRATMVGRLIALGSTSDSRLPDPFDPNPIIKKPKRKRGRSDWFEENRHKLEEGQHSDFHLDFSSDDDAAGHGEIA
jgi:hypothetical protein